MTREFRIFAEISDGKNGHFHEEFDYICQENYLDEIDLMYLKTLAIELFPDVLFIQIYELAEEIKIPRRNK